MFIQRPYFFGEQWTGKAKWVKIIVKIILLVILQRIKDFLIQCISFIRFFFLHQKSFENTLE